MTENNGSSSSSLPMFALAAVAALVALVIVFGRGSDDPASGPEGAIDSPVAAADASLDTTGDTNPAAQASAGGSAPRPAATASDPETGGSEAVGVRGGRLTQPPIPPHILEDFQRGTAPISPERRAEMERGRQEMPEDIAREFAEAGSRPIPPAIERDFENPYPPISKEELDMLYENGRNPGALAAP